MTSNPEALFAVRPSVTDLLAERLITVALAKAAALECKVTVAVVDGSGIVKAMKRTDGASLMSVQTAVDKAFTATATESSTMAFFELISRSPALLASIPARPGLACFGGGVPITSAGAVCGAVGVSGGSAAQDHEIAEHSVHHALANAAAANA